MPRLAALTLSISCSLMGLAAVAQTAPAAKPPATVKKAAPKPATPRQELKSEALGLALAVETTEAINAAQLEISSRVLTGKADCEYSQTVEVDPVAGKPGLFNVRFKGASYVMVPEETTTGAVRLYDNKAGMVWLQIPVKSMLLNARAGHRLVDRCTHSEQRAAVEAVKGAASTTAAAASPAAPRQ